MKEDKKNRQGCGGHEVGDQTIFISSEMIRNLVHCMWKLYCEKHELLGFDPEHHLHQTRLERSRTLTLTHYTWTGAPLQALQSLGEGRLLNINEIKRTDI